MNYQLILLHERMKILISDNFYEAEVIDKSFVYERTKINIIEATPLKTDQVTQKNLDEVGKNLSLLYLYLLKKSESMLRVRHKYFEMKEKLINLRQDMLQVLTFVQDDA